jgi:hypothetical protein
VTRRIRRHPLEPHTRLPLTLAAALRVSTSLLQSLDQLVASPLQLDHVGDVSLGPQDRVGWFPGLARLGVGGELRLEPSDLATQLVAPEPLVPLDVG